LRLRSPEVPWLIPIRFDDCDIPDLVIGAGRTLDWLQRADLFGDQADQQLTHLVQAVAQILGSREVAAGDESQRELPGAALTPSPPGAATAGGTAGPLPALGGAGLAARPAYLRQVRRIAPPDPPGLVGRDAELAELAGFCTEAGCGPYAWWRAGAWAGKSA